VTVLSGLTWDHPRGRDALETAAGRLPDGLSIRWHAQPLEGFESAPIAELARDHDLLVLDHPHLGDALASESLRRLDELFPAALLAEWADRTAGPGFESYRMAGGLWALPLDAATQVGARRADLLPDAPEDWTAVLELSRRVPVALNLAGPHAFLSLCSIAVAFGHEPGADAVAPLLPPAAMESALALMREVTARAPAGSAALNPIALLTRMAEEGDIVHCPLVYGYVNFSSPRLTHPITFSDAPAGPRGRRGSTIGGTGIAVTARAPVTPPLLEHLAWLMAPDAQECFIPAHNGQPSARAAWADPTLDADAGNFYRNTIATLEQSWVRPRFPGYIPFQTAASAVARATALGHRTIRDGADEIARLHARALEGLQPTEDRERT
jgi:multiple sugar transport system substrate-binding protein